MEPGKRNIKAERGQSLSELAIGFVVLLVLLAGIVDLSRMLFYSVSLRDAAEEGVHYGSLKPSLSTTTSDTSDIVNHVRAALDPSVNVTVTFGQDGSIPAKDACTGDVITVVVTQPDFQLTMPFIGALLGTQHLSLTSTYSGIVLRPPCQ